MSHVRNVLQPDVGTKIDVRDHQAKIDERDHLLCGCDPSLLIQCRVISKVNTHIMVSDVQPDPPYLNF